MRIQEIRENQINFKKIQLSKVEQEKAAKLLADLPSITVPSSIEKIKLKLFDIFDSHLQNEASRRSEKYVHKEDFLQTLYLKFFELLERVKEKDILSESFIDLLNEIKPGEDRKGFEFSIDKPIRKYSKKTFADYLTKDDLAVYASQRNEEERMEFSRKIQEISTDTILTENEKTVLKLKKEEKSFKEISEKINRSQTVARRAFLTAIAKIQKQNNILPQEYEKYALLLKEKYKLELSVNSIVDYFIKNSLILQFLRFGDFERIKTQSDSLKLPEKDYIQLVLRCPTLLYYDSKKLREKASDLSDLFKIDENEVQKIIKRHPALLTFSKETIKKNIQGICENFNISAETLIKYALKQPSIFAYNPETLKANSIESANELGLTEAEFIKIVIKQPGLLFRDSKKLKKNLVELSKIYNLSEKEIIKIFAKQPVILSFNPETLQDNIDKITRFLNITKVEFIQAAKKQPSLFYQKPESTAERLKKASEITGIAFDDFVKLALKQPTLLIQNPQTLKRNIIKSSNLLGISPEEFINIASVSPSMFYRSPESLKENIASLAKIFHMSEQELLKRNSKISVLFSYNSETLKEKIAHLAKIYGVEEKEFAQRALHSPNYLTVRPEHQEKSQAIRSFYKKIQKKEDKTAFKYINANNFYLKILTYLIKKDLKNNNISKTNLVEIIKSNPDKSFTFNLPKDECAEEFIQYVKDFFEKNIGTQNYKFFIEGKEIK